MSKKFRYIDLGGCFIGIGCASLAHGETWQHRFLNGFFAALFITLGINAIIKRQMNS